MLLALRNSPLLFGSFRDGVVFFSLLRGGTWIPFHFHAPPPPSFSARGEKKRLMHTTLSQNKCTSGPRGCHCCRMAYWARLDFLLGVRVTRLMLALR